MDQKKKSRKWVYGVIAVVVVAAAMLIWNNQRKSAEEKDMLRTYTLEQRDPLMLKGTAEVTEAVSVFIDPSKGEVKDIKVTTGQAVKAGDVLFSYVNEMVDDSIEDAKRQLEKAEDALATAKADLAQGKEDRDEDKTALEEAESNLEKSRSRLRQAQKDLAEAQAKKDLDDMETYDDKIYKENLKVSELTQDVSRLKAKVDSWPAQISGMEKAVTQSETMVEDATVMLERTEGKLSDETLAEIDGIVIVHEENKSNPQGSLVDILAEETEIKATVTEYDYFRLSKDQPVTVHVIPTDETMPGTISDLDLIPKTTQATSLTADTSVNYGLSVLPERNIQPGYSIEIEVSLDEVIIPTSAIVWEDDNAFLWQYADGVISKKAVTVEQQRNYWILVDGVDLGAVIIQNPSEGLTEGQEVKVAIK
ncbi:MAG: hypothetical protein GX833_07190 [Clostridium sp.]|jgi:HlyD family secretion protein|nr:hypothetical protein [Clostridium sp.]